MSSTIIICLNILLVLCCMHESAMSRHYPILPSAPSTALPLGSKTRDNFVTIKPSLDQKQRVFHRREVNGCMPKGSTRSSAPSRYVNYHALGSSRCISGRQSTRQP